jgi:hypothetical protein
MPEMRALTIKQPYAWAIAVGAKSVENRTWHTAYRGPLAIHAGKTVDRAGLDNPRILDAIAEQGFTIDEAASRQGAVVAVAEVVGCHHAGACVGNATSDELGRRGHLWCTPFSVPDQYHIELASVRRLPEPVPCKGMLGLWRLPEDVEKAVREELGEDGNDGQIRG